MVTLEDSFKSPAVLVMLAPGARLILAILSTLATMTLAPTLKYSFQEGTLAGVVPLAGLASVFKSTLLPAALSLTSLIAFKNGPMVSSTFFFTV